jgi:hypothetical protein
MNNRRVLLYEKDDDILVRAISFDHDILRDIASESMIIDNDSETLSFESTDLSVVDYIKRCGEITKVYTFDYRYMEDNKEVKKTTYYVMYRYIYNEMELSGAVQVDDLISKYRDIILEKVI